MENIKCPKCGQTIDDADTRFCPKCGVNLYGAPWTCAKCGQENAVEAQFCKACGFSREENAKRESTAQGKMLNILQSKRFLYIVALVIVMLVGGFGSYSYFNGVNETKYLSAYANAARDIEEANSLLSVNIKSDILKTGNIEDINKQIREQKDILDELAINFSQQKPFSNYEEQHRNLHSLLQKESTLLEQVIQITSNPLDNNTDSIIENIKDNVSEIKSLDSQIQVPNATFLSGTDLSTVPQQLSIFVSEKKQINKEKLEKLAAYQEFFKKMDNEIQRYEAAKTDLGAVRDGFNKEGMIWNDYFNAISRAKSARSSVRYVVNGIDPPVGTEYLKQQFLSVLDTSIRYCDTLHDAGNLRMGFYFREALEKEKTAKSVNDEVQSSYASFMEAYGTEKKKLTNINNL